MYMPPYLHLITTFPQLIDSILWKEKIGPGRKGILGPGEVHGFITHDDLEDGAQGREIGTLPGRFSVDGLDGDSP
jgi:hypothetical protein